MTARSDVPVSRQRGSIRRRARCYEVRVSAGEDPSTRERIVLVDSVEIEGSSEPSAPRTVRQRSSGRSSSPMPTS
jgi:integrase